MSTAAPITRDGGSVILYHAGESAFLPESVLEGVVATFSNL